MTTKISRAETKWPQRLNIFKAIQKCFVENNCFVISQTKVVRFINLLIECFLRIFHSLFMRFCKAPRKSSIPMNQSHRESKATWSFLLPLCTDTENKRTIIIHIHPNTHVQVSIDCWLGAFPGRDYSSMISSIVSSSMTGRQFVMMFSLRCGLMRIAFL